jgi:hypothetical protein
MEQSEAVSKKGHKRKSSADRQVHKRNWKECVASVEEIQNFLMDKIMLRHNVITGRAFNDLSFKSVKYRGQRGYVVELRNGEEIQRLQRKMVDECDVDSGQ